MYLKEINKHKWKISENLKIRKVKIKKIDREGQELHLIHCMTDEEEKPNSMVYADSSSQKLINKLSKSEFYTLNEVLISTHPRSKDYILEIKGILEEKGYSIRLKKTVISKEEKQKRMERMKQFHFKKGEKNGK